MTKEFTPDPVFHSDADNKFVADEYKPLGKEVYVKKETGLDAMAGDGGYQEGTLAGAIRMRMRREGKRFWAGDNISDYMSESDKEHLIDEAKAHASDEAKKIVAAAHAEAAQEVVKAREALREQVAALAVKGAEQILRKEVNAGVHADLLGRLKTEL